MKTLFVSFFTALLLFSFSFSAQAQRNKTKAKTGTLKVDKKPGSSAIYRDSLFNKNNPRTQQPGQTRGVARQGKFREKPTPNGGIYRDSLFMKNRPGAQQPGRTRGNRAGSTTTKQTTSGTSNGANVTLPGTGKGQQKMQQGRRGSRGTQQKVNNQRNSGQKGNTANTSRKRRKKNN